MFQNGGRLGALGPDSDSPIVDARQGSRRADQDQSFYASTMAGLQPMEGLMDTGGFMNMGGMNVDMLPMDLDMANLDPSMTDPQSYNTPITPQAPSMMDAARADPSNDGYGSAQNSMSGIGAGPLPTGFGLQTSNNQGSTLTEFTKRRNWSQRVLEELRDFLHILTPDGRILYVSPSCRFLTGWEPHQLVGKFIVEFIHPDDSGIFVREFNESIASGNPLRFFHRFRKEDDTYTIFESHGHPHIGSEAANFGPNPNGSSFCRGFFMMSRPYPTKNAALLDSFLEHKIENERLMKRIAELRREEQEEQEAQERHWQKKQEGHSSVTPSETQRTDGRTDSEAVSGPTLNYGGMPPPAKPSISNTALTRQNLDEALAASKPDSINDKMARYEGATHLETIEMLTGLRYRDGERSQGISTGDTSPVLIRGDAGIAILPDRDTRAGGEKKKKLKVADEYVCTDCGTLDSPEWRKGPNGPKTLCNACGLRWAKKEKKRQSIGQGQNPGSNPASMPPSATGN
ncbi:white collar 2 type of transcription factor [Coniosporium tulheliwenetii]|uniref:White collar 2 type of transcription factor n=1 Tax=Coniosporium tulheliwenetii TaxID=3383036 RepID=A0ACC2ZFR3_9PEZI|nr:white collar 2 type of transcription factor [Cladosporium sp. JES 115]